MQERRVRGALALMRCVVCTRSTCPTVEGRWLYLQSQSATTTTPCTSLQSGLRLPCNSNSPQKSTGALLFPLAVHIQDTVLLPTSLQPAQGTPLLVAARPSCGPVRPPRDGCHPRNWCQPQHGRTKRGRTTGYPNPVPEAAVLYTFAFFGV